MKYKYAILILAALLAISCGAKEDGPNPSGTLEATEVEIASELAARIVEVRKDLGDDVKRGDTLIVLDTRLIALQRAQAEAARASLHAQRNITSDAVRQASESLDLSESTLNRNESLFEQGSVTQQQLDELRTKRDVTRAQLSSAQHQVEALDAEENKLEATLSVFDRQLEMGAIVSPFDGTVILRNAQPGEMALPGSTLMKIARIQNMELRVYLSSTDLAQVKLGESYPVLIDALGEEEHQGRVIWISSEAEFTPKNTQTRESRVQLVYAVKLSLDNVTRRLAIGMPAEVVLASK
ncbi:efflux RND transporter periplasmic adaptor subunit [bacterium]|nr:efflux RND transporter periplasmic adaptor subunit [bacterium]